MITTINEIIGRIKMTNSGWSSKDRACAISMAPSGDLPPDYITFMDLCGRNQGSLPWDPFIFFWDFIFRQREFRSTVVARHIGNIAWSEYFLFSVALDEHYFYFNAHGDIWRESLIDDMPMERVDGSFLNFLQQAISANNL